MGSGVGGEDGLGELSRSQSHCNREREREWEGCGGGGRNIKGGGGGLGFYWKVRRGGEELERRKVAAFGGCLTLRIRRERERDG